MPTAAEIVRAFLAGAERPGGLRQAILDYFTPETVWENVGMSNTTGPEAAMAVLSAFGEDPATLTMRIETLAFAVDGDKVLTERIDHLVGADGRPLMTFPLMGVFEVKDGKITAWRDYFDTASIPKG
jgi:limonene-1,2-epoxide hydrolase